MGNCAIIGIPAGIRQSNNLSLPGGPPAGGPLCPGGPGEGAVLGGLPPACGGPAAVVIVFS